MTPKAARRTIQRLLPDFAAGDISLLGSGTDNAAFLVNKEWVCRFPLHTAARDGLQKEVAILPHLTSLGVRVPQIKEVSQSGGDLAFVRYRQLPGQPLTRALFDSLAAKKQELLLDDIAHFLQALHDMPLATATAAGVRQELFKGAFYAEQSMLVDRAATVLPGQLVSQLRTVFASWPISANISLLHADLKPEHILYGPSNGNSLSIIDWGDVCLGDPDYDFACVYLFYDASFLQRLLERFAKLDAHDVLQKVHFFACVRYLQDIVLDTESGKTAMLAGFVDALRSHLKSLQ